MPRALWRRFLGDTNAVAFIEFAIVLPVLLTLGLFGAEIARLSSTNMRISQIALSVADNASRLGQTDNSGVQPTITEANVDAILGGAMRDGAGINLQSQGRIILSSLEYDSGDDRQFVHWQRCRGDLESASQYGPEDPDLSGPPITGLGKSTNQITAQIGQSVMFVEVVYTYDPLFNLPFGTGTKTLRKEAAFLTRHDRNLGPGLTGGSSQSSCS